MSGDLERSEPLLASPDTGADAHPPRERVGEVALVRKADGDSDLGQRLLRVADQLLGTTDARAEVPAMGRNAGGTAERAGELGCRQASKLRQFFHLDGVSKARLYVVDHTVELPSGKPTTHLCPGDRPMQVLHGEPPDFGRIIRLDAEVVPFRANPNGGLSQFILSESVEIVRNAKFGGRAL